MIKIRKNSNLIANDFNISKPATSAGSGGVRTTNATPSRAGNKSGGLANSSSGKRKRTSVKKEVDSDQEFNAPHVSATEAHSLAPSHAEFNTSGKVAGTNPISTGRHSSKSGISATPTPSRNAGDFRAYPSDRLDLPDSFAADPAIDGNTPGLDIDLNLSAGLDDDFFAAIGPGAFTGAATQRNLTPAFARTLVERNAKEGDGSKKHVVGGTQSNEGKRKKTAHSADNEDEESQDEYASAPESERSEFEYDGGDFFA